MGWDLVTQLEMVTWEATWREMHGGHEGEGEGEGESERGRGQCMYVPTRLIHMFIY